LAGLQLGAGGFVGPELVTDGHRAIPGGTSPVAFASGLERDGTVEKTDARYARRRVAFLGTRHWRQKRKA
jgi:hypothetical protein